VTGVQTCALPIFTNLKKKIDLAWSINLNEEKKWFNYPIIKKQR
jgi:hypothetical protein